MDYPSNILPHNNRQLISTEVCSEGHLIRHTDLNPFYDEFGLFDKAIANPSFTHMPDLSCSLLGEFLISYIKIEVINDSLIDYCSPNENIEPPIFKKDFVLNNERFPYFIKINNIEGRVVSFKIGEEVNSAVCSVRHTPMKWNFWHFSVNWFLSNENQFWHRLPEDIKKRRWSKERLAHETRSIIKKYASTSIE